MQDAIETTAPGQPQLHVVRDVPEQIVCPPWCETPVEAHQTGVTDPLLDGECQHVKRFQLAPVGSPNDMWLCCTTKPNGTAYDGSAPARRSCSRWTRGPLARRGRGSSAADPRGRGARPPGRCAVMSTDTLGAAARHAFEAVTTWIHEARRGHVELGRLTFYSELALVRSNRNAFELGRDTVLHPREVPPQPTVNQRRRHLHVVRPGSPARDLRSRVAEHLANGDGTRDGRARAADA
jgi:hypothetical protein